MSLGEFMSHVHRCTWRLEKEPDLQELGWQAVVWYLTWVWGTKLRLSGRAALSAKSLFTSLSPAFLKKKKCPLSSVPLDDTKGPPNAVSLGNSLALPQDHLVLLGRGGLFQLQSYGRQWMQTITCHSFACLSSGWSGVEGFFVKRCHLSCLAQLCFPSFWRVTSYFMSPYVYRHELELTFGGPPVSWG